MKIWDEKEVNKMLKEKKANQFRIVIPLDKEKDQEKMGIWFANVINCNCDVCLDRLIATLEECKLELIYMKRAKREGKIKSTNIDKYSKDKIQRKEKEEVSKYIG